MHIQDFGQTLPQSQDTADPCFTSALLPPQIDASVETRTTTYAHSSFERDYPLSGDANGAGPIKAVTNDAQSIVGTGNGAGPTESIRYDAGPTESIRYDAGSTAGIQNVAGPIEGIRNDDESIVSAGPTEGIDLNKTPSQKSKRKKHRPKVLKEGKPSKTPKSTTPKPPKGKEQKQSGKRKYVRKKTASGQPPPEQAAEYNQGNAHSGTQAQLTERYTKDCQPSISSINLRDVPSQLAYHTGSTINSIYSSENQIPNAQVLFEHNNKQKGVQIDLNSSMNLMQNEHTNFVDSPAIFQSRIRETLETNPLLELRDGMPHQNVPDLNSSISLLQSMSTNFSEYLLSSSPASLKQTQMANQILNGHRMPENPILQTQCFETASTRDTVTKGQMLNSYMSTKNQASPASIEGNSVMRNSNKFVTADDYLRINSGPYRYMGAAYEPYDSIDSSNGAHTLLGPNFSHQINGLASVNAYHPTISTAPYFPETYKRMRLDNHDSSSTGFIDSGPTMAAYLLNDRNGNMASTTNSNVFTLADAQRLIAREKSLAAQKMISFGSTQNNVVKKVEMDQYKDSIEVPVKQFRLVMEEHTQLSSNPNSLQKEKITERTGSHQFQSLGGNVATWSDAPAELNKPSISTGSEVLRTEDHQLELSPKTSVAKPIEKRKVGRPRKEVKPGEKPRPRGRPRKEKIVNTTLVSNASHNNPLQNSDISGVSRNRAGGASCASAVDERAAESIPGVTVPQIDPLDLIIQKITLLDINKSDDTGATEPHGALVPYKGEFGAVVPFEGNMKRRRSRAKVDLDPVTTLMWKLLMGPDMGDGAETMDKDKEKWLDEERKIFEGRVDSFIARMHLVQGDRRFSRWKGSVVDSVVGVFLTQNVSDHLSSSAFMALAAKFPVKQEVSEKPVAEVFHTISDENDCCPRFFGEAVKLQGEILVEAGNSAGSLTRTDEKEGSNSIDLFGSSAGDGLNYAAGVYPDSCTNLPSKHHESNQAAARTGSFVEAEDGSLEDVVSSQNSTITSQSSPDYLFHINDHMRSSTFLNLTAEDFLHINIPNGTSSPITYTEFLQMQEIKSKYSHKIGSSEHKEVPDPFTNKGSLLNESHNLRSECHPLHTSVNCPQNLPAHHYGNDSGRASYPDLNSVDYSNAMLAETGSRYPLSAPYIAGATKPIAGESLVALLRGIDGSSLSQEKSYFPSVPAQGAGSISPIVDKYCEQSISEMVSFSSDTYEKSHSRNASEATYLKPNGNSNLQRDCITKSKQIGSIKFQSGCNQPSDNVGIQTSGTGNGHSSNLCQKQNVVSKIPEGVSSDLVENSRDAKKASPDGPTDGPKAKKARVGIGKKKTYDWDILRKEVFSHHRDKERSHNAKDTIDWETIRQADVKQISDTIRERGMNNMLAERIKDFLNRLVRDHGSIDLEWLRYIEPDKAKDYLLSIRGLGLKSVECVRLLTLHHMAFPVDTNVGRICVRLGWVPLQPLPESLQLHLLEMYPMLENIQKYLWPRLCKLDQRTLYELHYQMITFGKVFCTKSKPNCNACPMRAECKHFASAFASARLALPGPEENSLVASGTPLAAESSDHRYISFKTVTAKEGCNKTYSNSSPVSQLEWSSQAHCHVSDNLHPIIEEPASPELESEDAEIKEDAIEDAFIDDPEEIPTIKLNFEEFTQNLKNYMQANNIEIEDADMSKALVAVTSEAASIPTPKLKNVSRLRTEHQVYELPDSHPLLEGFDQREPDDPCPYLLSIWTPGETSQSTDAPKTFCNSQENSKLCETTTCFSCNSIREVQTQKVRGTILVPCRTAMRGSFPLNGTYFQVNEVFADHDTSRNPVDVGRSSIWNLPRRTVYFGTSIPSIFKGLTTEGIQHCFWRGFVCVRGFDRTSRGPRPLYARLHFSASKLTRNKKSTASTVPRDDE